MILKVL
jgi:hypothetical protein